MAAALATGDLPRRRAGSALRTLAETATLFCTCGRRALHVLLLALAPLVLLLLASNSYAAHLLRRTVAGLRLPSTPGRNSPPPPYAAFLDDAARFFAVLTASSALSFTVSVALAVAVVHLLAAARSGQEIPTLADVGEKLKLSWKRAAVTELTTTALRLCYSATFAALLAVTAAGSRPLLFFNAAICLLAGAHLESLLHMATTVSVLEKDRAGPSALRRAAELTSGGGWEAFRLSLSLLPAGAVVFAGLYVVKGDDVWFGVAEMCVCVAAAAAERGAWVVFYSGCVERRGEFVDWQKLEGAGDISPPVLRPDENC